MHTCIYTCIYIYMRYVYMCVCIYMYIHIYTDVCIYSLYIYTHTCVWVRMHVYTYTVTSNKVQSWPRGLGLTAKSPSPEWNWLQVEFLWWPFMVYLCLIWLYICSPISPSWWSMSHTNPHFLDRSHLPTDKYGKLSVIDLIYICAGYRSSLLPQLKIKIKREMVSFFIFIFNCGKKTQAQWKIYYVNHS